MLKRRTTPPGSKQIWVLSMAGAPIPGTDDEFSGVAFSVNGMPATGSFDQTSVTGASIQAVNRATPPNIRVAGHDSNDQVLGSAALTIDSLGPATMIGPATLYQQPHGHLAATLPDQKPQTPQPDVMATITF